MAKRASVDKSWRLRCCLSLKDLEVSQNYGHRFDIPHNKDCNIFGSILGSPHFGTLPFERLRKRGPFLQIRVG